jgi:protein-disulfide isomerase
MGKAERLRAERRAGVSPPPRRATNAPRLSRRWLWGGAAAAALAAAVVLIAVNALGGRSAPPAAALDGSETAALLAGITQSGASLGSPAAPVVLYEFADLQCPFCQRFTTEVLPSVVRDYVRTGKVRIVFRGLTFIGPDSEKALRAVLAAGRQNRLWNAADLLYLNQGVENSGWVTGDLIREIAAAVPGLDASKLSAAEGSPAVTSEIASASGQAARAGIHSTPSFLVAAEGRQPEPLPLSALTVQAFRTAIAPYVR